MEPEQPLQHGDHEEYDEEGDDEVRPEDIEEVVEIQEGNEPMDEDDDDDDDEGEGHAGQGQGAEEGEGMQTMEDTSIAAFYGHGSSVFTVSLHPQFPNPPIAISGGEDDAGYIWSTHDGEPIVKLGGHTDSVVAAAFNFAGDLAATGGMDGRIRVWKRRAASDDDWKTWEFLANLEGPDEVVVSEGCCNSGQPIADTFPPNLFAVD